MKQSDHMEDDYFQTAPYDVCYFSHITEIYEQTQYFMYESLACQSFYLFIAPQIKSSLTHSLTHVNIATDSASLTSSPSKC